MADNKIVIKLDKKLIESGVIDPLYEKEYVKVHKMLNSHVRKTGKILSEETFKKGDEALRKWLMLLYKKGASQEKLTSYLRCGLAHLCFDFIESMYHLIPPDELATRSLLSFRNRNYDKTFFRVSASEIEALKAKKRVIKKKVIKRATKRKKKPVKRKVAKKKTSVKKTVKKKSAKKIVRKKKTIKTVRAKAQPKRKAVTKRRKKRVTKKKKGFLAKLIG